MANLVLVGLIGMLVSGNPLQMLFDFSPQVRALYAITALVLRAFALGKAALAVQQWSRRAGKRFDRSMLTAMVVVTLLCAFSLGMLG